MEKGNKVLYMKLAILASIGLIYGFVTPVKNSINHIFFVLGTVNVEVAKEYILSFGVLSPVISFFLMVFQSVIAPLPAFIITFANAALFGWWKGAILSWTSAMAGATLCFYIAKYFGRSSIEKLTSKFALENVDKFFDKHGNYAILIARLLPFISFDIVSYVWAGLTSMSFWNFFWATGIGQLPATIIYSYVGGMLVGGTKKFVFGLLILFSLSTLILLVKSIYSEKNKKE